MELKDLLNVLDLDAKDLAEFKSKFGEKFALRSEVVDEDELKAKITGRITGGFNTHAKRVFGLSNADIEGKKWEEIMELGYSKLNSELEELKSKPSGSDEAKEWQTKYEKLNKKYEEAQEQQNLLTSALETTKTESEKKYNELRTSHVFGSAKSKLDSKLRKMSALEQAGFDAAIKNNIFIEFDEKNEVIVKGSDGKRIQNPNKMGSFLTLDEALELQAVQSDLIAKNDGGKQTYTQTFKREEPLKDTKNTMTGMTIHPNALKHAEQVKNQMGQ